MNKRQVTLSVIFALSCAWVIPAGAQDKSVDERRIAAILRSVEIRANGETDTMFGDGEFPKAIQAQRMRLELRPWDENLATDLIWMLGNIELDGEALIVAMRFRELNPRDPNRGYAEALLYNEWRMYAKVPRVLESDIMMVPPPHRNSYSLLAGAYTRMGFDTDVIRVLDVALKHYSGDVAFQNNRARAAARLGRSNP